MTFNGFVFDILTQFFVSRSDTLEELASRPKGAHSRCKSSEENKIIMFLCDAIFMLIYVSETLSLPAFGIFLPWLAIFLSKVIRARPTIYTRPK